MDGGGVGGCCVGLTGVFCVQIIAFTKEEMKKASLSEQTMISIIWTSVMSCVEWNKKEELVTEQAIKHLKVPGPSSSFDLGRSGSCFSWKLQGSWLRLVFGPASQYSRV